jgi:hypothetical protein
MENRAKSLFYLVLFNGDIEQIWLHFNQQFYIQKIMVHSEFWSFESYTNSDSEWGNESFIQQISP